VRRVVVTGVGVVSPAGTGLAVLQEAVRQGRSFTRLLEGPGGCLGAPACGFDAEEMLGRREARRLDRGAQLFAAAARLALEDAGLWGQVTDGTVAGVFEGTALGGLGSALDEHARLVGPPAREPRPRAIVSGVSGGGGAVVALAAGLHGPCVTCSTGSVSSAVALGAAADQIRLGAIDWALAGGGEAPLDPGVLRLLAGAGMLSGRAGTPECACRPFDATRDGTVLAEAGAVLVLESPEHAGRRGARVRAELLSFATTTDGADLVAPAADPAPRARSISLALERAGVDAGTLDLVVAHGTATRANDPAEARALRVALGEAASAVPVVGLKGGLGHALGACTALETAVVLGAIADGFLPPTVNLEHPDPECALALVRGASRPARVARALVHSASFGGRNAALVLGAPPVGQRLV
jgi:3-oxoacyl-[acyl-carrier-protein] synthase II